MIRLISTLFLSITLLWGNILLSKDQKVLVKQRLKTQLLSISKCTDSHYDSVPTIEYTWDSKILTISRMSADFNCATRSVDISATVCGDKIYVVEDTILDYIAGCSCGHDLSYQITDLKAGKYILYINDNPAMPEKFPSLIVALDLRNNNSGITSFDGMKKTTSKLIGLPATLYLQKTINTEQPTCALIGSVINRKMELINNASIKLKSPNGDVQETHTDPLGNFFLENLQPGTYSISFSAPGYKTISRESCKIVPAKIVYINVALDVSIRP